MAKSLDDMPAPPVDLAQEVPGRPRAIARDLFPFVGFHSFAGLSDAPPASRSRHCSSRREPAHPLRWVLLRIAALV